MKAEPSMGLVLAGGLHHLFLSRMPTLLEQLGPIKATSFHVARRSANSLHAGYAVSPYSALEGCSLIWIAVAESAFDRVALDLAAQMPIHRTMIVLCDMVRDSASPNPLRSAGARIATVNQVSVGRAAILMGEGHEDTLRRLRRLFAPEQRRFMEVLPAAKATYFAGVNLASQLLLPWIDAAAECLRNAGLSRAEATELIASLSERSVRSYSSAGRKAWNRRSAAMLRKALEKDAERLGALDPSLGALYAEGIRLSFAHFGNP